MSAGESEDLCRVLVIGYGNELRGDDAAGPRVARTISRWRLSGVRALALHQLTPEVAEELVKARLVLFVDAHLGLDPGSLRVELLEPAEDTLGMAHTSDPGGLLALAQRLHGRAPAGRLLGIPALSMAIGQRLSPYVRRGMREALRYIERLVRDGFHPSMP
jgi:hydrogenase maturation protease